MVDSHRQVFMYCVARVAWPYYCRYYCFVFHLLRHATLSFRAFHSHHASLPHSHTATVSGTRSLACLSRGSSGGKGQQTLYCAKPCSRVYASATSMRDAMLTG